MSVVSDTQANTQAEQAAAKVKSAGRAKTKRNWGELGLALLYMGPALLIFIAFTFYPFVHAIGLSLFITDATGSPAHFNGLNYYARILNLDGQGDDEYLKSIITTIEFALMTVPLGIVMAIALAVLAMAKVKAVGFFRTIFTSSIAISVASASVIWALIYAPQIKATQWVLDFLHLNADSVLASSVTALPAIALMTVWTSLGFNFIITLSGIQAISQDIYESGMIDGANGWRAFRFLTFPLLTPTLLFLVIISTISCFQAFTQFEVLIGNEGPDNSTNVFVLSLFNSFWKETRYGFASAMSVVLFIVLLIMTLLQFRLLDRRVHYQ